METCKIDLGKMLDNKQEYILCSAIKLKDENVTDKEFQITYKDVSCWKQYGKIDDIYLIETGRRHPDILYKNLERVSKNPHDQGFYTSFGRFVTREEAAEIAYTCGQIKEKKHLLFSEDLY